MSPSALGLAALLHALVAAFLIWAPVHHPNDADEPIEVTMEAPPPPEKKPEPEPPKPPPPPAQQVKPPSPPQQTTALPGLPPPGAVGPKSTAPPMERGQPNREKPPEPPAAETPTPKEEPPAQAQPPQQAMARPAEPPPPPPPKPPTPTLEKELPPVDAPLPPVTSRDIPRISLPVPEHKPEPAPRPPQPQPQPRAPAPPQLAPSPLSRLPRNTPSQRPAEEPRSTFVNPADTYAQNTLLEAYLQRVAYQVSRYHFDGTGLTPNDSVVARFTIARNGNLLSVGIARSSGKANLDRDAVTAFQQVAPFPPLPAEVSGDSHTFVLTFWPGRAR